jgi:N6-adenosine-specific RNA methylase IME4
MPNSLERRRRSLSPVRSAAAQLIKRREIGGADRLVRVAADEARVLRLRPVVGKFRTLVIDPAWEYDWLSLAGRAKPGYAMQTHEELLALDLRQWADEAVGCHLYCWTTNNFMTRAGELVARWGFQHRVVLTWIKPPPFGLGSYFRNQTEHVLFATLGDTTTRPAAASLPTYFEAPRGEHSEKPEKFYEIVRAASYPPYGDGNQRTPRPDFINLFREGDGDDGPADDSPFSSAVVEVS